MSDDDPFADFPDDLGEEDDLARAEARLTVRTETRRYGKPVTIIEGFEGDVDVAAVASELKSKLGAGGTVDNGRVEIQGDHADRVPDLLREQGFRIA